jgi:hypothetical protein
VIYSAPVSAPALRYTRVSSRRFLLIVVGAVLLGPVVGGLYSVASGEDGFVTGAIIWLVVAAVGLSVELAGRRQSRHLHLHGDQLETDDLWVDLTTDGDIHLKLLHGGRTLALVLGRTRVYLGGPWCASHFESDDLRAMADPLERSMYERCAAIGKRLRLLADDPRHSSWPEADI